jgi:S1-C subfamily serine protease
MKNLGTIFSCALALGIFAFASEITGNPTPEPAPNSQVETAPPEKSADQSRIHMSVQQVQSAVVLVTVFDPTGKLLRSGTGFFISDTGRFVTTLRTAEGGLNGVVKTADDAIYNISGILNSSSKLDLAVLQADAKNVQPAVLSENDRPDAGAHVAVIGSVLAGTEGALLETTISGAASEKNPNELRLPVAVPDITLGAPVVDENGAVVGIVISRDSKDSTSSIMRPIGAVKALVTNIAANAAARWPSAAFAHTKGASGLHPETALSIRGPISRRYCAKWALPNQFRRERRC